MYYFCKYLLSFNTHPYRYMQENKWYIRLPSEKTMKFVLQNTKGKIQGKKIYEYNNNKVAFTLRLENKNKIIILKLR